MPTYSELWASTSLGQGRAFTDRLHIETVMLGPGIKSSVHQLTHQACGELFESRRNYSSICSRGLLIPGRDFPADGNSEAELRLRILHGCLALPDASFDMYLGGCWKALPKPSYLKVLKEGRRTLL